MFLALARRSSMFRYRRADMTRAGLGGFGRGLTKMSTS
jgi:hypothetical protein